MRTDAPAVEAFIARHPQPVRETMEALRSIIRSEVPNAEEVISYQVPCFRYGTMLVGYGAGRDHCSLYTMNPTLVREMKTELAGLNVSGSTIRFSPGAPLPELLIRKIVRRRVEENKERALGKTATTRIRTKPA